MDTASLETLQIVAKQGSLVAAARELGLTANAVALRLRVLEAEFGKPLVARSGRVVRLTEAGHAVLGKLPEVLESLRNLRVAARGNEIAGELRIGAIGTALTGLLPPVLETLSVAHPDLQVHLEPGTSADLFDRVSSGTLDAAAIVAPEFEIPKSTHFDLWRYEPMVLMVSAAETRTDIAAILSSDRVILYDRSQWGGRLAYAALIGTGAPFRTRFELDALDAIAVLVDRGLGVAVVPDWAGPRPERLAVTMLPLPDTARGRGIGLFHQRQGPRAHLVSVLSDAARACIRQVPAAGRR